MTIIVIFLAMIAAMGEPSNNQSKPPGDRQNSPIGKRPNDPSNSNQSITVQEVQKGEMPAGVVVDSVAQLPKAGQAPNEITIKTRSSSLLTWQEIALSYGVLVYSLILFGMLAWLKKNNIAWDVQSFKIMATLLLVSAALFIMTAAYTETQAAPLFGLLGTLAGYILSKSEDKNKGSETDPHQPQPAPDPAAPSNPVPTPTNQTPSHAPDPSSSPVGSVAPPANPTPTPSTLQVPNGSAASSPPTPRPRSIRRY